MSDQAALNVTGSSTIHTKLYFLLTQYEYDTICFRFVVGSKKSNDARVEEMNLCNQNI